MLLSHMVVIKPHGRQSVRETKPVIGTVSYEGMDTRRDVKRQKRTHSAVPAPAQAPKLPRVIIGLTTEEAQVRFSRRRFQTMKVRAGNIEDIEDIEAVESMVRKDGKPVGTEVLQRRIDILLQLVYREEGDTGITEAGEVSGEDSSGDREVSGEHSSGDSGSEDSGSGDGGSEDTASKESGSGDSCK